MRLAHCGSPEVHDTHVTTPAAEGLLGGTTCVGTNPEDVDRILRKNEDEADPLAAILNRLHDATSPAMNTEPRQTLTAQPSTCGATLIEIVDGGELHWTCDAHDGSDHVTTLGAGDKDARRWRTHTNPASQDAEADRLRAILAPDSEDGHACVRVEAFIENSTARHTAETTIATIREEIDHLPGYRDLQDQGRTETEARAMRNGMNLLATNIRNIIDAP